MAIVSVEFSGDIKPAAHEPIRAALEQGLTNAGVEVVTATSEGCSDNACMVSAAEGVDATHAIRLDVSAAGNDYDIALTLVDRGGKASKRSSQCQICGFAEVATMVGDEAGAFGPTLLRADAPASFHIESTPSGSEVRIDGELVGETPLDVEITPGEHVVAVSRDGYSVAQSELVAVPGVQERLTLGLVELPKQRDPNKQRRLRVAGWSLIGVGVATAGGGAAALVLHHKSPSNRCTPDVIDANGLCQWRYNTLPVGIPLVAAGAASLIAGAVLAAVGSKDRSSESKVAVSFGPDGVLISGRF